MKKQEQEKKTEKKKKATEKDWSIASLGLGLLAIGAIALAFSSLKPIDKVSVKSDSFRELSRKSKRMFGKDFYDLSIEQLELVKIQFVKEKEYDLAAFTRIYMGQQEEKTTKDK